MFVSYENHLPKTEKPIDIQNRVFYEVNVDIIRIFKNLCRDYRNIW